MYIEKCFQSQNIINIKNFKCHASCYKHRFAVGVSDSVSDALGYTYSTQAKCCCELELTGIYQPSTMKPDSLSKNNGLACIVGWTDTSPLQAVAQVGDGVYYCSTGTAVTETILPNVIPY